MKLTSKWLGLEGIQYPINYKKHTIKDIYYPIVNGGVLNDQVKEWG